MKYHVEIHKWKGDEMYEHLTPLTLEQAEALVEDHFGDVEWADTQMGFQVWDEDLRDEDFDLLFAKGGPELWEISMMDENGFIEEWSEDLLNGIEEQDTTEIRTDWKPE